MAWPCRNNMWRDIEKTRATYAAVAHAIARFEPVIMCVRPDLIDNARNHLGTDIELLEMPLDDSWMRDIGPSFLVNDQGAVAAGTSFNFNAWGGKYPTYAEDAQTARRILEHQAMDVISSELFAEGGSFYVDGDGTVLTTDTCLNNPNRNPDWTREQIETELKRMLGAEKVIWLPGDPIDEETDGHIDCSAAFARPGAVVVKTTDDDNDPRKPYLDSFVAALEQTTDAKDRSFEILSLPEAPPEVCVTEQFCRAYANYYLANGAVIAHAYGIALDDEVRERLGSYYPGREVVQIPVEHLAEGGGGIHCITQQQPASIS